MKKIFIDGKAGTTGLRIYERLEKRTDIEILTLSEAERKDPAARKRMFSEADVVFLCLPDEASIEAAMMMEGLPVTVIDTSTAHRTRDDWSYGFPELSPEFEAKIMSSKRIAVPGCHASGFIALVRPLIKAGILSPDAKLCCHSVTGYSGGGKKMIADYESAERSELLGAPRQYALGQSHKHLREMKKICGLENEPIFCPIVSDFYSGMVVTVPLFASDLQGGATAADIKALYAGIYKSDIVKYKDAADEDGTLSAAGLSGKDSMEISVFGGDERIILTARYDNLGKGASGAAVEVLNMILGAERAEGLEL